MGHIKTSKTLHLTEILTVLKSFNKYLQWTEDNTSQRSSSFFKNSWFLGLDSVISLQRLPRTILFKLICRVYAVNRFSKHRRGTTRACMECPGMYGDLQTGFEPIKFLDTRSVWVGHVIKYLTKFTSLTLFLIIVVNTIVCRCCFPFLVKDFENNSEHAQ